jgi:hypothetical protein
MNLTYRDRLPENHLIPVTMKDGPLEDVSETKIGNFSPAQNEASWPLQPADLKVVRSELRNVR